MKQLLQEKLGLYTDFYELTMAQGFFLNRKQNEHTSFDYFYRTNPYEGGFVVFAGLQDFIDALSEFTYSESDISYLKSVGFHDDFLDYLKDFKFSGTIYSVKEGEIVFPNEPLMRIEGNIIECQLIETLLLNILNFESLIATKAFRIKLMTGKRLFSDFGLRRAQGLGGIHASRAAVIGGASSTSNTLAGKLYNIPVTGTIAHSWILSFDKEIDAFRAYADANPDMTILLVDTYDTLNSGVPNAIIIAKELEAKGYKLKAIRLDSGDLAYLSKRARKMLDNAGLEYVQIVASNQLNEHVIKTLLRDQDAEIDSFGIGTEMVTGKPDAALGGVYKLAEISGKAKMKISENIEKMTLPGKKQLVRYFDEDNLFFRDGILLEAESIESAEKIYHPVYPAKNTETKNLKAEALYSKVYESGEVLMTRKTPVEIHDYLMKRSEQLPGEHKRFISPHIYKVGISENLMATRNSLIQRIGKKK
jgi:nicotinate phosphoribosyltransferase